MRSLLFLRELVKQEKINLYLRSFMVSERLTDEDLKKFQKDRLLELLKYLSQFNKYYSKYLKENAIKLDANWQNDPYTILSKLPLVDKLFIKKHTTVWLTTNKDAKVTSATTSGSTGMPFEIFHSSISRDVKAAAKFRLLFWHGVNRWEKQLYLGCTFSPPKSWLSKLKISLNNKYVWDKKVIDFTKFDLSNMSDVIEIINNEKPVTVWGYPSVIFEVAKYAIKNKIPIQNKKLKMVILSGESHTQYMNDIIHQAFEIVPDDEYNSNEGFLACTCEYHKLHLTEDTLIAEILDEDGTCSEFGKGELIVTHLYSYDYPFIRYNTGDIVEISKEKCKCGRNFKIITSVDGRKGSVIFNGKEKISNATCNHYVTKSSFIDTIDKYQIIQNEPSSVIIKLVVTDKDRDYDAFETHLKTLFDKIDVQFEYVEEIPRQRSGKYIDVISNVNQE